MPVKPIVAATDGSEESLRAVEWAAREATRHGGPLRIVSAANLLPRMVDRHTGPDIDTVSDVITEERDHALTVAAERAAKVAPDLLIDTDHLHGAPAEAVTEAGSGALMLVVGSKGVGAFTALILGSVSRYAATHAPCPVAVIRDDAGADRGQVVVGVRDQDASSATFGFAFEEAALRQASLLAVHAWDLSRSAAGRSYQLLAEPAAEAIEAQTVRRLTALLEEWQGKYPNVQASYRVVRDHPARVLVGLSAAADLVVLGRHARSHGLPGPGAVTHAVLNHAHGPVVTVPADTGPASTGQADTGSASTGQATAASA
jgi:nucleotide-binding universal stress UspA family protein